ncbi:MAG: UDP-N-acetylglucosamine 2-epimerase (hydrolyzing) [Muribaculaceae bacterium]|nr:UDP-N-acetylglucosamine 2-epimerase (hydrolyzing) [Muribaculaceae bacterium]
MTDVKPIVCIATGTRADWGLLQPIASELQTRGNVEVRVLATNMHLLEGYGNTLSEITAAGFSPAVAVPIHPADTSSEPADELSRARAMGRCLTLTAEALSEMRPDALVLLGDRYEMLAVASAAAMLRIPVVHLCGGEVSEGAIDDKLRHAITKLAGLHLVSTEPYRRRVIQMGEAPESVINIGSPGVWNLMNQPLMTRQELAGSTGIDPERLFAVVTYHPATLADGDPGRLCTEMFRALDSFPGLDLLVTYPNNDAGSHRIIEVIEREAAAQPGRITLIKSLGMRRYLSAITHAAVVVGNSSSGIIEVPAAGTPVVNIGSRQQGRLHSPLVIDCGDSADEISAALNLALTPEFLADNADTENPYSRPDTPRVAAEAIERFAVNGSASKHFHDLSL